MARTGRQIEEIVGRSSFLASNFPKIDRFQNGVATSIKSIDLSQPSYQNLSNLERTVKGYIDTMATYQGQQPTAWGGVRIYPNQVKTRAVDIAIPAKGATPAQLQALQDLQGYAASKIPPVTMRIIPIP